MKNKAFEELKSSIRKILINIRWGLAGRNQGLGLIEQVRPIVLQRLGTPYGGWYVSPELLSEKPTLLSAGVGDDCSFARKELASFLTSD